MEPLSVARTSTLLGDDVVNSKGEDMAHVREIVIDVSGGRVVYAVLSLGGLLGMRESLVAVPWEALRRDPENQRWIVEVPPEKLAKAPRFDKNDWPDMSNPDVAKTIYSYYGLKPYWES